MIEGPLTDEGVRLGTELLQLERRQRQLNNSVIDALKVAALNPILTPSLPQLTLLHPIVILPFFLPY